MPQAPTTARYQLDVTVDLEEQLQCVPCYECKGIFTQASQCWTVPIGTLYLWINIGSEELRRCMAEGCHAGRPPKLRFNEMEDIDFIYIKKLSKWYEEFFMGEFYLCLIRNTFMCAMWWGRPSKWVMAIYHGCLIACVCWVGLKTHAPFGLHKQMCCVLSSCADSCWL